MQSEVIGCRATLAETKSGGAETKPEVMGCRATLAETKPVGAETESASLRAPLRHCERPSVIASAARQSISLASLRAKRGNPCSRKSQAAALRSQRRSPGAQRRSPRRCERPSVIASAARQSISLASLRAQRGNPCSRGHSLPRFARRDENGHSSPPNKSRVYTLPTTSLRSAVIRLATITSASALKAAKSFTTRELKNSGSVRAGS